MNPVAQFHKIKSDAVASVALLQKGNYITGVQNLRLIEIQLKAWSQANGRQLNQSQRNMVRTLYAGIQKNLKLGQRRLSAPAPSSAQPSAQPGGRACNRTFTPKALIPTGVVGLSSIIGYEELRKSLQANVVNVLKFPEVFAPLGKRPENFLLYGPGGTGKTTMAEAIAREAGTPFFQISASDIKGKFVGETEACMKLLIQRGIEEGKKTGKPVIILIDEADALLVAKEGDQSGSASEFKALVQPQSGEEFFPVFAAATNNVSGFTGAVTRRFGITFYVGLPLEGAERIALLKFFAGLKKTCTGESYETMLEKATTPAEWTQIEKATLGYTPAELKNMITQTFNVDPLGTANLQKNWYCKQANGTWDPKVEGTVGCVPFRDVPVSDQSKICWNSVTGANILKVIKEEVVRRNTQPKDLENALKFAQMTTRENDVLVIKKTLAILQNIEGGGGGGLLG